MSSILIVDDDRALCRTLQLQLELAGHEVETAYNAASGLKMAAEMGATIVLLDVNLPDVDGVLALPEFLTVNGVSAVVIMTAAMDNAIVVEGLTAVLISINKYFGVKTASIGITGVPAS